MTNNYSDIDLELEKIVFLFNAFEGNPGIYELTYELGHYLLNIEDKYKIAHKLLSSMLQDGLVTLEKFADMSLKKQIEIVSLNDVEEVLNNPSNWYPCNEVYAISLTKKGEAYLDEQNKLFPDKLEQRLFKKKSK